MPSRRESSSRRHESREMHTRPSKSRSATAEMMPEEEEGWDEGEAGWEKKGSGKERGEFAHLSKEELYQKAKEAGIRGRSKMTKDELIEKLKQSSRS